MYLTEVDRPFAAALFCLIGDEANKVADVAKEVDRACRVTKVERLEHLVASHTKPWRVNERRVNGENGLLLVLRPRTKPLEFERFGYTGI